MLGPLSRDYIFPHFCSSKIHLRIRKSHLANIRNNSTSHQCNTDEPIFQFLESVIHKGSLDILNVNKAIWTFVAFLFGSNFNVNKEHQIQSFRLNKYFSHNGTTKIKDLIASIFMLAIF